MRTFHERLVERFGDRVRRSAPLAPLTTFRVGGPAEWLLETLTGGETVDALRLAHEAGVPVTVLGGGSNVLVSDRGVRGIVIRPRARRIEQLDRTLVRADAGATVNGLVRWTINRGLAGLEAWAGTPGTVGGGVCGNAHFGERWLSERTERVRLASPEGLPRDVSGGDMEFGYDRSRLQRTREVLLWAVFRVEPGDPAALRAVARRSLAHRKQTQPLDPSSAGCVFQNPDAGQAGWPDGLPRSAGALIDRAGLKGRAVGRARVSPVHANFIVNEGGATAAEIRLLVHLCQQAVREQFGVELHEEIVYLGEFDERRAGA